jgi:replication factor C small subunit
MTIQNSLWTERYRPTKLSDYIFSDATQKLQIEKWVKDQDVPNLLITGPPGTGKSTIAYVLINELHIDPYDVLWINASRERNIDIMRDRITSFVSTMPFGKMKIVVLDEGDGLNQLSAQPALRGIMEEFSMTSRFLITGNYPHRIIPAIHSRTQSLTINKLDITEFTVKMAEILIAENIEFDPDILDDYVKGTWPDLRKCINNCQQNSINGKLINPTDENSSTSDYKIDAISLFKSGKIREARQLICSQIRPEELEDFFRFCYDNLSLWGETTEQTDQAILIIKKNLCQIPVCADAEILASATLIELTQL